VIQQLSAWISSHEVLFVAAVAVAFGVRAIWQSYRRKHEKREAIHSLAADAAAIASVKYAEEHPRELQAAVYCDGTAEDAASYRKGRPAAEQAAYAAVLADPAEAVAAAIWRASDKRIRAEKLVREKPPANEAERAAGAAYLKRVDHDLAELERVRGLLPHSAIAKK
jgi:hypothetical protein